MTEGGPDQDEARRGADDPFAESDSGRLGAIAASPAFARLPTGTKLFLSLSAALLPLALIAVFAVLQQTRLADAQELARLRVASEESARAIAIELTGDMTALRAASAALARDPADAPSCARALGAFALHAANGPHFAIEDPAGTLLCGARVPRPVLLDRDEGPARVAVLPGALVVEIGGGAGRPVARAIFPQRFLERVGRPSSRATSFSSALTIGDDLLPLERIATDGPLERVETMNTALGIDGLLLRTTMRSAPITSSLVIALLLPLVMWAAAAAIAWFVVDRLLIRPLRQLRARVAAFRPGEDIDPGVVHALPAQEIRDLGETFRAISRTVAAHEADMAEGLVRQTKLTREVHHRVKNNLQVIASLINFHARGASSAEAIAAYHSIQRRVDALAVVHRHHFAELEVNRGLNLRTMMGELAANLRATAPEGSGALSITLDVAPFLVNQDVAVALGFLVTEIVELAMNTDPSAQIRVSVKDAEIEGRAMVRVVARALVDSDRLAELLGGRYGRVLEGLARQLRAPLHRDPLSGAFEITVAVLGRD